MTDNNFVKELFVEYPITNKNWKVYSQNAYKICIKFRNMSDKPREMTEYRRGNDGSIELDKKTNKPKLLEPNEIRYISIEPSNKAFKYENSNTYGSASYPKKIEDARKAWRKLKPTEVKSITKKIYKDGIIIPFYQIASTYISLYGGDHEKIMKQIEKEIHAGKITLPHLSIMFPKSLTIGIINTKKNIGVYKYFPTTYANIPLQKGMLFLIKLNYNKFKKSNELKLDKENLIYPIDAPAVKASIWKPIPYNQKKIKEILEKIKNIYDKNT